ncbi:hypothetical protein FE257_007853 [Aspergillus nanangensis]|uniref:AMP-dependent synthetase/ligase domain-containing protein n=1 Tax=Aspergillus nanangensis TaxID=2582783 RepID=A0AAD4CX54_ASPNN|nr:hypothetical protein FE257_007853 [Aspergillus nanangensis]
MASSTSNPIPRKLWEHPSPESTQMKQFQRALTKSKNIPFATWAEMHSWAVKNPAPFWDFCWTYFPIIHEGSYTCVVDEASRMDSIPRWFEGVRLNYAENILYSASVDDDRAVRSTVGKEDDKIAVTEVREGCSAIRHLTWGELRRKVARLAQAMKAHGVKKGDRVAAIASNSIDTLCVLLAVTSLGGVFSSSSTDMGVHGILGRLLQTRPTWVFMDDWAVYNGKTTDLRPKMRQLVNGVDGVVEEFRGVVAQSRFDAPADISGIPRTQTLETFVKLGGTPSDCPLLHFQRVDFRDPFLIAYSSGTTGLPKCIVHSTGGVILSGQKELRLHHSLDKHARMLQYTTTGWIMYLVQVQTLLTGARAILYDGSPFVPNAVRFVQLLGDERVTHLGISPKYLQTLRKASVTPRKVTDLSQLQVVTSTGMVLSEGLFEWFYDEAFPKHTHLANIAGGSDMAGCFGAGNPVLPLYAGGCQSPSLGVAVEVYDSQIEGGQGVKGRKVEDGEPGELVATTAFPNMPVTFWGEGGDRKYWDVWTHGDFVTTHPVTKQILFLGRADGVLNPSGVRFGSAEIYNVLEAFFSDTIQDSICVGQRRPQDDDERVILFLLMVPGVPMTAHLVEAVKQTIARECSKRHVPRFVFETPEIPTTVNLKKVELPVKQIVSGKIIVPSETLLNPQCLEYYYQFAEEKVLSGKVMAKL